MADPVIPRDRSDFSAIVDRPPLKLPRNNRIVFWTIVNYEVWDISRPMARQVIPAPTDYYVTQAQGDQTQSTSLINKFYDLLPSVENLSLTSRVMKEYIGLFVYRLRGWL